MNFKLMTSIAQMTRARVRQSDITRAVRGAREAGADIRRVEVDATGTISVIIAEDATKRSPPVPVAPQKDWRSPVPTFTR